MYVPLHKASLSEMDYRTCFWAGDTFAPKLRVKDAQGTEVSIQQFLQSSFLASWEMLIKAVGDLDGVIGFEVSSFIALSRAGTYALLVDHERAT